MYLVIICIDSRKHTGVKFERFSYFSPFIFCICTFKGFIYNAVHKIYNLGKDKLVYFHLTPYLQGQKMHAFCNWVVTPEPYFAFPKISLSFAFCYNHLTNQFCVII